MTPHLISSLARGRQRGVTLVELMVTIAINLVLVLAATLLYLNTRTTQRDVNARSAVYETGQFALGLLARDITTAGFYPAAAIEQPAFGGAATDNVRSTFDAAAEGIGLAPAYAHGVFGCAGAGFDGPSASCKAANDASVTSGSDALVLAYFTEDAFSLSAGQRADCTRTDVIKDVLIGKNHQRATYITGLSSSGSGDASGGENKPAKPDEVKPNAGPLPDAPLLVINAYHLEPGTLTLEDGREVSSSTLTCWGNGSRERVELVQGVEQFVVRYGLMNDDSRRPFRYVSADQVGLQSAVINGEPLKGWQMVSTIRVCMLVRSPQATVPRDSPDVLDCNNNPVSRADNGVQVRRFEQVFSVKNRQGNTVGLRLAAAPGGTP